MVGLTKKKKKKAIDRRNEKKENKEIKKAGDSNFLKK